MGNAYATPTPQNATPAPQMALLDLDVDQEKLGNEEVKSRMTGEALEIDGDPDAKGQAEAATQTALGEVTPVDPDADLADFSSIVRVFERASEQAREQLAQHLQIHTREDWLAAAQADFQSHLQDFETFGFQARAHEARVQRALRLVAAADQASAVALRSHELQGRVRGAEVSGIEIDPEAAEDDLETMQDAKDATRLKPGGMAARELELKKLRLAIDDVATAQLGLGSALAERRAALLTHRASAPAGKLAEIDEAIKAIDLFGGLLEGAVGASASVADFDEKAITKVEFATGNSRPEWNPRVPRASLKGLGGGPSSMLGQMASLAWEAKSGELQAEIGALDTAASAATGAAFTLDIDAAWGTFDGACSGFDAMVESAQVSGGEQRRELHNLGASADAGTGMTEHEDAGERLASILDASQLRAAAAAAVTSASDDLLSFATDIASHQETAGYSDALTTIVQRTHTATTAAFDKRRRLATIARRLSKKSPLDGVVDGTRGLES